MPSLPPLTATLPPTTPLKTLVDALKDLVAEGNWHADTDALTLRAMDASHVALCDVRLDAAGFDSYACTEPVTLGVNLVSMGKLMKCKRAGDGVTLEAAANGETLDLSFGPPPDAETAAATTTASRATYALKLMDIDTEALGPPPDAHAITATLASAEFQRVCKDLASLGDQCALTLDKTGARFVVSGDVADADVRLGTADVRLAFAQDDNTLTATGGFAVKYLLLFTKATGLASEVTLSLSTGEPVRVSYVVEGVGRVWYYLAPRVGE